LLCGLLETDGEVKLGFNGDLYPSSASVVMTTKGDMVDYDTSRQRLGIGSANQILQVKSSLPSWETVDLADTVLTTAGDVLFENATPELARLPKGSDADVFTLASGLPSWAIPAIPTNIQYSVATMSGVDFDFDSTNAIQEISISANTTFTGSNYAAGKSITLFITTDGTLRTLAFPSDWIFQGTKPTDQAASKVGTLTLLCASTTEASVRCAYAVEE